MPIGMPFYWPGTTPPDGAIVLNGAELSRTEYPDLFAVLGTTYGAGDGSTTFTLPDEVTKEPVRRGVSADNVGRTQGDAIRDIVGSFKSYTDVGIAYKEAGGGDLSTYTGAFSSGTDRLTRRMSFFEDANKGTSLVFKASLVVPTAEEVRMVNIGYLPCIWAY